MSRHPMAHMPTERAIPELYVRYHEQLRRLGLGLLGGNGADAEDLVQETFLRAYEAWDGFEGRSEPSTWLYTIAWRTAARMRRRRSGEPRPADMVHPSEGIAAPAPDGADPLESLIHEEEERRVHDALERLPIRYRLPISLKEIGGLSVEEIGAVLQLSDGTVKSRLHRGRAALSGLLDGRRAPDLARGRRSRATTLCPRCQGPLGSEDFARHACEVAESGDEDELRHLLGLDPAFTPV